MVRLAVYNVLGQKVQELVNGPQSAGNHQIKFNANRFSSGVYIYRLEENGHVQTRKMILLK
jgi:serine protease AprX